MSVIVKTQGATPYRRTLSSVLDYQHKQETPQETKFFVVGFKIGESAVIRTEL